MAKKKKGKLKTIVIVILILIIAAILFSEDEETEKITNISDSSYTLMVYVCGSDLESDGGYATIDIAEMLEAIVDEKINLIVETGGSSDWQDYDIANDRNQIYQVKNNELNLLEDNFNTKYMTDQTNLSDFVTYCKENFPADNYGLILWDHGGGAISGYCVDENNEDENETLTLDKIKSALTSTDVKFDFVGFDACLMANVETAYALKDTSEYLIASEETEPGTGWDYKSLLNTLSSNTSQNSDELGETIVDSFIESNNSFFDMSEATLSVIDLSKMDNVFSKLTDFIVEIKTNDLDNNNFNSISKATGKTKAFGEGEIDTFDLIDFASNVNNSKTQDLVNAVEEAVVYNKTTDTVSNSNGMSIYIPYSVLEYFEQMLTVYPAIGINGTYTDVLKEFANYIVGGQNSSYSFNGNDYYVDNDYSEYDWYDLEYIESNASYYDEYDFDDSELEITDKGEYYALELSDEDWEVVSSITCQVFLDDGEGYIDLGNDNYYEFDEDGDLKVDFDTVWVSIGGQTVSWEVIEETDEYTKGIVQATLNDELVDLIIYWENDSEEGEIVGIQPSTEYGNTSMFSKGIYELEEGDRLSFVFDYYTYDGEYDASYILGDELVIDSNTDLSVRYMDTEETDFYIYYKIIDIYGNEYYTEAVVYE